MWTDFKEIRIMNIVYLRVISGEDCKDHPTARYYAMGLMAKEE